MDKCDNITNKYYNIAYVNKIKKIVNIQEENPKLIIETIEINNYIKINVIQE
jgi:hypothetical protein